MSDTVGRIERLTTELKTASPFRSAEIARELGDALDVRQSARIARDAAMEERQRCLAIVRYVEKEVAYNRYDSGAALYLVMDMIESSGLPRCSCGHDRPDHWSSGDPVPICTYCDCERYTPEHADYQCAHNWYTYYAAGAPDHDMCLLCCKTRKAPVGHNEQIDADLAREYDTSHEGEAGGPGVPRSRRVVAVLDEGTCPECAEKHGVVLSSFADIEGWIRDHAKACDNPEGCRCALAWLEESHDQCDPSQGCGKEKGRS